MRFLIIYSHVFVFHVMHVFLFSCDFSRFIFAHVFMYHMVVKNSSNAIFLMIHLFSHFLFLHGVHMVLYLKYDFLLDMHIVIFLNVILLMIHFSPGVPFSNVVLFFQTPPPPRNNAFSYVNTLFT